MSSDYYTRVKINANIAMKTPSIRHAIKNNIYAQESLIPWDENQSTIVYFVSGINGDEFGQFPTLVKALMRLEEVCL